MTFYDQEDLEIGAAVRTVEAFSLGQVREFAVNPAASISKAVLAISKVALDVARDSSATHVNEQGVIEVVPPNTPRFNYNPVTLAPLGLLLEPEAENLIAIPNINIWTKTRVTVTPTLSIFGDPVYLVNGNGATQQHDISLLHPTATTSTLRTLSIYMKNEDNRFSQIAIGSDPNAFADFDLQLGVLATKANVESSLIPAGGGWYRCTITIASTLGISFLLYLTTAANDVRAQ